MFLHVYSRFKLAPITWTNYYYSEGALSAESRNVLLIQIQKDIYIKRNFKVVGNLENDPIEEAHLIHEDTQCQLTFMAFCLFIFFSFW